MESNLKLHVYSPQHAVKDESMFLLPTDEYKLGGEIVKPKSALIWNLMLGKNILIAYKW